MLSVYAFRISMAAFFCPGVSWLNFLLSSSSATWDCGRNGIPDKHVCGYVQHLDDSDKGFQFGDFYSAL